MESNKGFNFVAQVSSCTYFVRMVGARRNPEEQPLKGGGAGPRQWKVKIDRNLRLRVNW